MKCYETLIKLAPDDIQAKSEFGAALIRAGDTDRALKVLQKVTVSKPMHAQAHNSIGFAFFTKKKYSKAALAFKRAVEIDPSSDLYRFNLGMTLALNKNRPGALAQYRAIKEKAPERARLLYQQIYRDKLLFVRPPEDQ